jgi:hypothetical protein
MRPASKAIIAAAENSALSCPDLDSPVTARKARPIAVSVTPAHCRGPSSKPKKRSLITPRMTRPPASTACTSDSAARVSAAT